MSSNQKFSARINQWLSGKGHKTLGNLQVTFDDKSFAVAFLILMALPALPLPTGGVTHVLEVISMLLALELIIGLHIIWLPKWAKDRQLGTIMTEKALPKLVSFIKRFENLSRQRFSRLFAWSWFLRTTGIIILTFTISAFLSPPFSGLDTLPALGVVMMSLGWLFEDTAIYLGGIAIGILGFTLNITLASTIVHLLF